MQTVNGARRRELEPSPESEESLKASILPSEPNVMNIPNGPNMPNYDTMRDLDDAESVSYYNHGHGVIIPFHSGKRNLVKCRNCEIKGMRCRAQKNQKARKCFECRRDRLSCPLNENRGRKSERRQRK